MATADELLAGASSSDNKTLVIDHYTRKINIPSGITNLGVENDDEVLRLNFKMPRYLSTTDLSEFPIRINYINAQGEDDIYVVTDATVVGDYITFSWLVGPSATAYKGYTKFNVNMLITDASSVIQQEYNTTIATLPVLEGLECSERIVAEYSDILLQWETRLFGIGDTEEGKLLEYSEEQQQNIVDKGVEVLATIPEDYTETYNLAHDSVRTRANAIVSTPQGDAIVVNDASDDYLRGLRIFGKTNQIKTTGAQLFDGRKIINLTGQGVTMTNDGNGVITISGTSTAAFSSVNIKIEGLTPGTYYASGTIDNHTIFYVRVTKADGTYNYVRSPKSFTLDGTETEVLGYIYAPQGGITYRNAKIYPMLNAGDTALPWEPYSGGVISPAPDWPQELTSVENPTVQIYGKNLLPYPYYFGDSKTTAGVTFTANEDGGITMSGTPEAYAAVQLVSRMKINSDITVALLGEYTNITLEINVYSKDNNHLAGYVSNKEVILLKDDFPEGTTFNISIKRSADEVEVTGTVYPIVVAGDTVPTEYVPYVNVQAISTTATLPGIPVSQNGNYTDANDQQWICDEIDYGRGVYVQRVKQITFNGSENWGTTSSTYLYHDLSDHAIKGGSGFCSHLPFWYNYGGDCIFASEKHVYLGETASARYNVDVATWTAYLAENPVTLTYILATPIETALTAEEIEAFKLYHSNYPHTTVVNDSNTGMELQYNADTQLYFNNSRGATDEQVQNAVDAWLSAYFTSAEGVSF